MRINNKSIFKSRLRLTKPAFVQLVLLGLNEANGFATNANGFDIVVHSIEHVNSIIEDEGISQKLLINISIKKIKGWMPLEADSQLQINWKWSLVEKKGYPAIQIIALDVASMKKTEVGLFNFNFGLPGVIERKVFGEVHERIPQIEAAANKQIKKACNKLFSKTYDLTFAKEYTTQLPQIKLEKWLWGAELDDSVIFIDIHAHAQTSWMKTLFEPFKFHVNERKLPKDDLSVFRLPLPYRQIYSSVGDLKIPLGKARHAKIDSMRIQHVQSANARVFIKLVGDVNADVNFDFESQKRPELKFIISNLELNLENKLLDFGASLFENKIEGVFQREVDKQLVKHLSNVIHELNDRLDQNKRFISIGKPPLSLDDLDLAIEFHEDALLIELRTSYFSRLTMHELPSKLIQNKEN